MDLNSCSVVFPLLLQFTLGYLMFTLGEPVLDWAFPDVDGWWLVHHSPAPPALLRSKVVCSLDSTAICPSHATWEVNLASSMFPNSLGLSQNKLWDFSPYLVEDITYLFSFLIWDAKYNN